jgi:pilus assembly protein CpaC
MFMAARRTNRRLWPQVVRILVLFSAVGVAGQVPPAVSPSPSDAVSAAPPPWAFNKLSRTSGGAPASAPVPDQPKVAPSNGASQTLYLVVGRSLFINTSSRLRRVYISNPEVLASLTANPHELIITAKAAGTGSVVVWSESGESAVYNVLADIDVEGLSAALAQALPDDHIEVESRQRRVFLSGTVGADSEAEAAGKLALVYSKDVINSIVVDPRHRPQVQLKIEIAELDRSKLDTFGINLFSLGNNAALSTTGQFAAPVFPQVGGGSAIATLSDALNLFYFNSDLNLGVTLKDLQNKGVLEILAEPTLLTIHGQAAKFLAGGEFPYPVVQPSGGGGVTSVTIQFRQYGVKLEFTPFVNPDGTIRLKVAPEVSALDYTNQVVIAGYTLPAISTRKAETEIELRDGQSFGISGLLDHRTTEQLSKVPGIGDIPILGQLFRSKNISHSVMELVVIATPTIVDPLHGPTQAPAEPNWVTPPGQLNKFDHGWPK